MMCKYVCVLTLEELLRESRNREILNTSRTHQHRTSPARAWRRLAGGESRLFVWPQTTVLGATLPALHSPLQ